MKRLSLWLVFVFAGLVFFPSDGSAQAPYYAGKTITVIEGNSAVSGVDFLRHDYFHSSRCGPREVFIFDKQLKSHRT